MNSRHKGTQAEDFACVFLRECGFEILERNFFARYGEIDIIAFRDGVLVACEVKYRSGPGYGDPLESVDFRKQKKICRTMLYYYTRHGYSGDTPCRFDVIAIYGDDTIKHLQNAFEFRS